MNSSFIRLASRSRIGFTLAGLYGLLLALITSTASVTGFAQSRPTITSFTAAPGTITVAGGSSQLSWSAPGATSIAITPGTFTSTSASGSTTVTPTKSTSYTLTASNSAGSVAAVVCVKYAPLPVINSFTANPASIAYGSSSTLSFNVTGATGILITPGTFKSASATGSTTVSPTTTMTYTLTANSPYGPASATTQVAVTYPMPLFTTTSCPGGTQNTAYVGCTLSAMGGTPPYTFSVNTGGSYPPLPEGMSLDGSAGQITAPIIGGQGDYSPQFIVTDANGNQGKAQITFAINGSNAFLANIFPSNSIFHHRVDAATTGLPVDTSPAAAIDSVYLPSTVKPIFGTESGYGFPNGIPAIEVPYNQADVPVSTTKFQSYFTSGPIPAYAPVEGTLYSDQDRHVLVYVDPGPNSTPALYELWGSIYEGGPWTDSSNALWSDVTSNNLTPQGKGTSDAAGLPVGPLLVNADEVIGTGTPAAPNGVIQHPIRFTLNHTLNYWVWPATQSAGVGVCYQPDGSGKVIPSETLISQATPPASCTMSGPTGEIYRLQASVPIPACAATSPQAAIIITALQNYGIILADNGESGGLIGTPDARWNTEDLLCLTKLTLSDFEPVNVSSLMVSNDSGQTSQ